VKIYVGLPLSDSERQLLLARTPGDPVWFGHPAQPTETDRRAFLEAEVGLGAFPEDLLTSASRLRWWQLSSAGVDHLRHLDWSAVAGRVTCTNMRGVFAEPMVQTALGGILALLRALDQFVLLKPARDWQKPRLHTRTGRLDGAHVLLLGAGSVTSRLRAVLEPFRCTFTTYGRTHGDIHTPTELDATLPRADIVCAALPETEATRDLINAARLAHFKRGAIFVNVGRGSLVVEADLIAALESGHLGGALLDVTRHEPLPPDDPLWRAPRTILTQHTCGGSNRVTTNILDFFEHNLARYRAGEPLENIVDWSRGY
jgi:glyoxylate/hydroxypyruvate reductase A